MSSKKNDSKKNDDVYDHEMLQEATCFHCRKSLFSEVKEFDGILVQTKPFIEVRFVKSQSCKTCHGNTEIGETFSFCCLECVDASMDKLKEKVTIKRKACQSI